MANNLARKNQSFPIHTSFLIIVINCLLGCLEELDQYGKEDTSKQAQRRGKIENKSTHL